MCIEGSLCRRLILARIERNDSTTYISPGLPALLPYLPWTIIHRLMNPIVSLLSSTETKPLYLAVCDCFPTREKAMNIDKAQQMRPQRRIMSSRMLLQVCIVIFACLSLVDSQNNDDFSGTSHAKLLKHTLINLHDNTLEANKDLNLSTADPADAARQVLARIGSSVSSCDTPHTHFISFILIRIFTRWRPG